MDSNKDGKKAGRAGGRKARTALRSAIKKQFDPCPPGAIGGQYKPLSDQDLLKIHAAALDILAKIGMGDVPDFLSEILLAKGANLNEHGRICFPSAMVEDIINQAAKEIHFHGIHKDHDIMIGGNRVYYGTGGAAVRTLDRESGTYRPSTLKDLYDFTRLADKLPNISWFTRCCVATDVPDNLDLDINTIYALIQGTQKPIGTSFFIDDHVDPIVAMFDMVAGGEGQFKKRPFCKAHISPIISPLRYGEDAVLVAQRAMQYNMPLNCIIAAQSGATAPAPLAGMLAQTTAETLAALIMVNVLSPGYPMIFSNWPFVIDLRTGSFSGSGGEISLLNAAAAQIGNWYQLPSGVASSMSDAKAIDAQMGMEKALSSLAAGAAGANMIYESSGMMGSLLGVSFEAFVIDNEMLSSAYRLLRGIEINEETLGFETIKQAVLGSGHFLGAQQTINAMERDYHYPELADRDSPDVWASSGCEDMFSRAKLKVDEILNQHYPEYISSKLDDQIRSKFKILLDRAQCNR